MSIIFHKKIIDFFEACEKMIIETHDGSNYFDIFFVRKINNSFEKTI